MRSGVRHLVPTACLLVLFLIQSSACGADAASGDLVDALTEVEIGDADASEVAADVVDEVSADAADIDGDDADILDTSDTGTDIEVAPPRPSTFRAIGGRHMCYAGSQPEPGRSG